MANIRDCPQCGLINPPTALQCDCGYNFSEQRPTRPYGAKLTTGDWIVCLLFPVIGLVLGLVRSVQGKPSGGTMVAISAGMTLLWILMRWFVFAAVQ